MLYLRNGADVGLEAQVKHAIRFIQHQVRHMFQPVLCHRSLSLPSYHSP